MSLSEDDQRFVLVADKELQPYLYAIMSARTVGQLNTVDLKLFLNNHFERSHENILPSTLPRCQDTLDYMTNTLEAVDFFVEFCILIFAKAYGAPSGPFSSVRRIISGRPAAEKERLLSTSLPLSMWRDKRRIRRALLRFQLYCELSCQSGTRIDTHLRL